MSLDDSARAQRRGSALPVRILAVALMLVAAISLLYGGLFNLLPMLLSRELRAEGLGGEWRLTALMMGTGLLKTFVTLVASVALLRDHGWARAWIVCAAVATIVMSVVGAMMTGDTSAWWPFGGEELDGVFAVVRLVVRSGPLALSFAALALLLTHRERSRVQRGAWIVSATAVLLIVGTGLGLSPGIRRSWDRIRTSATTVENGTGAAVVTLLYDGQRLAAPDGVLAHVTLQEVSTKQQTQVTVPLANGSITLPNLATGVYAVGVLLDANQKNALTNRNRPMAGDYDSNGGRISLLRNGEVASSEVKMFRMLRLLRPQDTEEGLAGGECARVTSPVEFEWEPVPRAVGYRCFVSRRWQEGGRWKSDYADSSWGPGTTCRMALPRSAPESLYQIKIEAEGETGVITRFEDPREGWASEYCFVVE